MDNFDSDNIFPFPIWMIPAFILLMYTIIMNGVSPDTVFTVIVTVEFMVIIALWGGFYKIWFKRKLDEELRKNHKTSLCEKVLKKIHSNQQVTYSFYSIQFKNPKQLYIQSEKDYELTFQHLRKKHISITDNWENTQNKNQEINGQLNGIKEYIISKIRKEVGKKYVDKFTMDVWKILQYHIFIECNSLNILKAIQQKDGIVKIEYLPDRFFSIDCLGDESKVINFFTTLKNDEEVVSKINKTESTYSELKSYFKNFKKYLEELIHKIDNNGVSELKGSCGECSFLKKC